MTSFQRIRAGAISTCAILTLYACHDIPDPTQPPFLIDNAASSPSDIVVQGTRFTDGVPFPISPVSFGAKNLFTAHRIFPDLGRLPSLPKAANARLVRHFRDDAGRVLSLATVMNEQGRPARVYAFQDGRVRFVVSAPKASSVHSFPTRRSSDDRKSVV